MGILLDWQLIVISSAREAKVSAELELLSSTSADVCEMWTGKEIVRLAGEPKTTEYIMDTTSGKIMSLTHALSEGIYCRGTGGDSSDFNGLNNLEAQDLRSGGPNLTLNIRGSISSSAELWGLFIFGLTMQSLVLAFSALVTYHWHWRKGSDMISSYGYPCFLIGSLGASIGIITCSCIIEASTKDNELVPSSNKARYQPLWIQRACTVDSQQFESFVIFNANESQTIKTLRSSDNDDQSLNTEFSTALTMIGFCFQFVGIRALHWSAALMQFGVTILMTCGRAYVRRGVVKKPRCAALPKGNEAAGMAYLFAKVKTWEIETGAYHPQRGRQLTDHDTPLPWLRHVLQTQCNMDGSEAIVLESATSDSLVKIAERIMKTVFTDDSALIILADQVVRAIKAFLKIAGRLHATNMIEFLSSDMGSEHYFWNIRIALRTSDDIVAHPLLHLVVEEDASESTLRSAFLADSKMIRIILTLWLTTLKPRFVPEEGRNYRQAETLLKE